MSQQKASNPIVFAHPIEVDSETNQICPQCRQWKQENEMSPLLVSGTRVCNDCHKTPAEQTMQESGFQKCRRCNEYKAASEFHRRGISRQRVCKDCRKACVPSGKKRIVWLNDAKFYPVLAERIDKLESKLRLISLRFANGNRMDADDIYGAMVDEILFKSSPEDSDSRILTRARWAAKAVVRRNLAYSMYVGDESEMTTTNEDGETDIDMRVSFSDSAEEEYIKCERSQKIAALISQLEPKYQKVVAMISLGHTQREIARTMNISEQSVSTYMKKIAEKLKYLGFSQI